MKRKLLAAAALIALTACGLDGTDAEQEPAEPASTASASRNTDLGYEPMSEDNYADTMASDDERYLSARSEQRSTSEGSSAQDGNLASNGADIADPEQRPIMQLQVVLDRQAFGPGVIDGEMGPSTRNALEGFQEANDLEVTGELNDETREALARWDRIPATRVVTIPASWGDIEYAEVPDDPAEQAQMDRLGYESLDEKLAERFHTTIEVLRQLNPGGRPAGAGGSPSGGSSTPAPTSTPTPTASASTATAGDDSFFAAGQRVRVPNIGADRISPDAISDRGWQQTLASLGVGTQQPEVARVVVDESEGWLKGYDSEDNLVAMFTVTTGSSNDPLPVGEWGVTGVGRNPPFSYQPELFWDVPDDEAEQQLPPGPNGPVGVVWIDLTKENYGIHGTNAPQTIGRAQSHGCVRLTNWDAARLAGMVNTQTEVIFQT